MELGLNIFVGLIAVQHLFFLILEMFLWTTPKGLKIFKMSQEQADSSAVLAKNQGLYNGFLAAALLLSLCCGSDPAVSEAFRIYGLTCVVVAGVFGGITVSPRLFIVQATPALIALLLHCFA